MAVQLHLGPDSAALADGLGRLLATPLPDPFAEELVVVPAKGVERWLTQRLSHRLGAGQLGGDGVCAGIRFLTPHSLTTLVLGVERSDVWPPDRLVWPLLRTIDANIGQEWCRPLAAHLGQGAEDQHRQSRRYSVARRLAALYASYAAQRPQLLTDWRRGDATDGLGGPLDADLAWQSHLWRALAAEIDAAGPDERLADAVDRIRDHPDEIDLPARISMFGHTRLPAAEISVLGALGNRREVHLWLPQASPALWAALAPTTRTGPVRRALDRSADQVGHPLLASLGRDAREMQRSLAGVGAVASATGVEEGQLTAKESLLSWLQSDMRGNAAPDPATRAARRVRLDDDSVQVHACHGPSRQIEVLREVLLGVLADDDTLEPRDVIVLCPDVDEYAPLISAAFGLDEPAGAAGHPAHRLRVRLADRSPAATNPLLAVAVTLLELSSGRATARDLMDLVDQEPVRRRFGFSDDDASRIASWVSATGIRWGADPDLRAVFAMTRIGQNTWQAGIDRLLAGVTMSEDDQAHLATALPLDDVGSSDIDLVGRLAELVSRVTGTLRSLASAQTVGDWLATLREGVLEVADRPGTEAWQITQFTAAMDRIIEATHGSVTRFRTGDARALLRSLMVARPTRSNFRTGTLTVCTMVPMRSVPHRVVCLVGLDDGRFPRSTRIDGDDVLARDPVTGERDPRSEDRQLLLDAVMAAGDTLIITYTGADERTGAAVPPAVPLGELLDALDLTAAEPARDHVRKVHPLHPYDARNLVSGAIILPDRVGNDRPLSFDPAALRAARAGATPPTPPARFLTEPLPSRPTADVNVAALQAFLCHPVRSFCRDRVDLMLPLATEEVAETIPVELTGLDRWEIGDRMLTARLTGADPEAVRTAELLRGSLPPCRLGRAELGDLEDKVDTLVNRTAGLRATVPRTLDVTVGLPGGRRLTGTVGGVYGNRIVSVSYASVRPRQRLRAWVALLALSAAYPDHHWTSHTIGRSRGGPTLALAGPVGDDAVSLLASLVELYDRGDRAPLAAPLKTACAWAEATARARSGAGIDPHERAERQWRTDPYDPYGIIGEDRDPFHERVYGPSAPLTVLLAEGMAAHAWTIWGPLVTGAERVGPL